MSVAFSYCFDSPVAVGAHFTSLSAPSEFIQLEPGAFRAKVDIEQIHGICKVSYVANRRSLCTGVKPSGRIQLSYFISPGLSGSDRPVVKGVEYSPSSVAGFGDDPEAHCVIPAGVKIVYYSLPERPFLGVDSRSGDDRFLELRTQRNYVDLSPKSFLLLRSGLDALFSLDPSFGSGFGLRGMIDLLCSGSSAACSSPSSRALVAHSFVRWCHANVVGAPPDLDLIAKALFVSRRSLIQAVKESFGCGPAEMYKSIRLQYCHHFLTADDDSVLPLDALSPVSVGEAMNVFGFKHRGSFAKSFRDLFGVSPGQLGGLRAL